MNANDELQQWRTERNEALRTLDMTYARCMLPDASSDEVRLMAMHKGRHSCVDMPDDLRRASAQWLHERGLTDMNGEPIDLAADLPR